MEIVFQILFVLNLMASMKKEANKWQCWHWCELSFRKQKTYEIGVLVVFQEFLY